MADLKERIVPAGDVEPAALFAALANVEALAYEDALGNRQTRLSFVDGDDGAIVVRFPADVDVAVIDAAVDEARARDASFATRAAREEDIRERLNLAIDGLTNGIAAIEGGTIFSTLKVGEKKYLSALGEVARGLAKLELRALDED